MYQIEDREYEARLKEDGMSTIIKYGIACWKKDVWCRQYSEEEPEMPYCSSCGKEFTEETKICPNCGKNMASRFSAECPQEGQQENSERTPESLKAFLAEVEEYDKLIAIESEQAKKGRGKSLGLTAAEKRKTALIQNFVFSNDKESVLGALFFIKTRMDFLKTEKRDRRRVYWARLWQAKAEQLYEKAQILASGNSEAAQAYADILAGSKEIEVTNKRRTVVGSMWILAVLLVVFLCVVLAGLDKTQPSIDSESGRQASSGQEGLRQEKPETEGKTSGEKTSEGKISAAEEKEGSEGKASAEQETLKSESEISPDGTLTIKNFAFSIPDCWQEMESTGEGYRAYAKTEGGLTALQISYPEDDEEVTLDALYADHENMIAVLESGYQDGKVVGYQDVQSDSGVQGILYEFTFTLEQSGRSYDGKGSYFCFPSEEDNRWFFVLMETVDLDEDTYAEYQEDYGKLLASIREVPQEEKEKETKLSSFPSPNMPETELNRQVDIQEYSYVSNGTTRYIMKLTNNSPVTISVSTNVIAKDSEGNTIGAASAGEKAIEKGYSVCLSHTFTDCRPDLYEYAISVEEEDYFEPVMSDLSYEVSDTGKKLIVVCTNHGKAPGQFVEGEVLFFAGDELLAYATEYFTDDGIEMKPGSSIAKEFEPYSNRAYDRYEIYFRGRR